MRRSFAPCLAAFALALALGACGSAGEQKEIEEVIVESSMSADPANCLRTGTMKMLEQSSKAQGEAAVRICEETAALRTLPERVSVSAIEVSGDEARADVAFEGSEMDGQTLTLALVKVDGAWKADEILAFEEFDREKAIFGMGRGMYEQVGNGIDAQLAECMLAQLEGLDDDGLEALILDSSPEPAIALARACEGSASA